MTPPLLVVAALVRHGRDAAGSPRYVVTRRRAGAHLAGYWELPGGKVEPGEDPVEALRRELREELGVEVTDIAPITFSHHRYPERRVLILFYAARTTDSSPAPRPLAAEALRLLDRRELLALPMPPANVPLLQALEREAGSDPG